MSRKVLTLLLVCCSIMLAACGKVTENPVTAPQETAAAITPTPEPTPTPVPTPVQDTDLPEGDAVTVDGTELASGSVIKQEQLWVSLEELTNALQGEYAFDGDTAHFVWREEDVGIALYGNELTVGQETKELPGTVMLYNDTVYVPLKGMCDALEIGYFEDAEYSHIYCTPGAGDWELPEGYRVPIVMYHAVAKYWGGDPALVVSLNYFIEQIEALLDAGYTPIFFEDLINVDQYEKPIILTFDDGYDNNYEVVYPILQEYNIKATFFIISSTTDHYSPGKMSGEQVKELSDSGLVSIQSHTVNHNFLDWKREEDLDMELRESQLALARLTGKVPFVLAYPSGRADDTVEEYTAEYYRFAVRMSGPMYYTGDDPINIWRIGSYKGLTTELFMERVGAVREEEQRA